ncbi:MAG: DNA polymerase domain-containing protein [Firmicutes bacterium]|nr:DNA polymerase domain-containing protein [Bacillota bacterium]
MEQQQTVLVDGFEVTISNWDRILWPEVDFTKGNLIQYYSLAAPYLLTHLRDRPLTVTRFPQGIQGDSFYQKNCPQHAPDFVETTPVTDSKGEKTINYILVQNRATLVWLANQACIELHPWLSLYTRPQYPDWVIFDLDPAEGCDFDDVREIAFLVRKALDELGLTSYPKLSGATGIHIYVPIQPKYTYDVTSSFVGNIGKILESVYPARVTTERLVKNRIGHVYVDHLQNLLGKTIAAPYSPRPLPHAPISTPVTWEELKTVYPHQFHLGNILSRLETTEDLFAPQLVAGQSLDTALAYLGAPVS